MPNSHIPDNLSPVTACIVVRDATAALEFYQQAFEATPGLMLKTPDGKLAHGEMTVAGTVVMLVEEFPDGELVSPMAVGRTTASLLIYVKEIDKTYAHAIAAGAEIVHPIENQFYGDRAGTVRDPFGHIWTIASKNENLTKEEIQKRAEDFFKKHPH